MQLMSESKIMHDDSIQWCQRCCYPSNHPFGLNFIDGVCTGCLIHEEKNNTDWHQKFKLLEDIVSPYKSDNQYDCIIPMSGGQDSYYIVYVAKYLLGLNPLLVCFNRLYNTPLGIKNLEKLRTRLGCDIITYSPKPLHVKEVGQATLELFGSFHWYHLAGHTVFPVQLAVRFNIPLIIWGAHQAVDQVGMFSHHDQVEMTRRYRLEHDLMGFEPEDLVDKHPHLSEEILSPLFYPSDKELHAVGVRGIYLNHYLRWDSKAQHELMMRKFGYMTTQAQRTFDNYHDVHCMHYNGVHDLIKDWKYGYTKVTDQVCREIRLGRITREEGFRLIAYYSTQSLQDIEPFNSFFNVSLKQLEKLIDPFRDERVWTKDINHKWHRVKSLKSSDDKTSSSHSMQFTCSETNPQQEQCYQALARGWAPDMPNSEAVTRENHSKQEEIA